MRRARAARTRGKRLSSKVEGHKQKNLCRFERQWRARGGTAIETSSKPRFANCARAGQQGQLFLFLCFLKLDRLVTPPHLFFLERAAMEAGSRVPLYAISRGFAAAASVATTATAAAKTAAVAAVPEKEESHTRDRLKALLAGATSCRFSSHAATLTSEDSAYVSRAKKLNKLRGGSRKRALGAHAASTWRRVPRPCSCA